MTAQQVKEILASAGLSLLSEPDEEHAEEYPADGAPAESERLEEHQDAPTSQADAGPTG